MRLLTPETGFLVSTALLLTELCLSGLLLAHGLFVHDDETTEVIESAARKVLALL